MHAAILSRLPVPLAKLKQKCKTLALVLSSDSAKANIRLARTVGSRTQVNGGGDGVVCVWALCLMHRTALAVLGLLAMFGLTVPLFCATVLLHMARVFDGLRTHCRRAVESSLQIAFSAPAGIDVAGNAKYLFELLERLEYNGEGTAA